MHSELTPAILDELRAQLEQARARLQADLRVLHTDERTEGREDPAESRYEEVHDRGEDSATLEGLEREADTVAVIRQQLGEVEHALSKFSQGTYGLCEDCGEPIPLARLRLVPEARYDARHQAEHEARTPGAG